MEGPILTTSRSPSETAPRIFLPARYVPFLLPRSSIVAPFGPIVIRACRRETDSSSIQTTASRSRPIRFRPARARSRAGPRSGDRRGRTSDRAFGGAAFGPRGGPERVPEAGEGPNDARPPGVVAERGAQLDHEVGQVRLGDVDARPDPLVNVGFRDGSGRGPRSTARAARKPWARPPRTGLPGTPLGCPRRRRNPRSATSSVTRLPRCHRGERRNVCVILAQRLSAFFSIS